MYIDTKSCDIWYMSENVLSSHVAMYVSVLCTRKVNMLWDVTYVGISQSIDTMVNLLQI